MEKHVGESFFYFGRSERKSFLVAKREDFFYSSEAKEHLFYWLRAKRENLSFIRCQRSERTSCFRVKRENSLSFDYSEAIDLHAFEQSERTSLVLVVSLVCLTHSESLPFSNLLLATSRYLPIASNSSDLEAGNLLETGRSSERTRSRLCLRGRVRETVRG
jgi:hypothetical protein